MTPVVEPYYRGFTAAERRHGLVVFLVPPLTMLALGLTKTLFTPLGLMALLLLFGAIREELAWLGRERRGVLLTVTVAGEEQQLGLTPSLGYSWTLSGVTGAGRDFPEQEMLRVLERQFSAEEAVKQCYVLRGKLLEALAEAEGALEVQ